MLTESWHSGWQVFVNDRPENLVRAYGDFIGVLLGEGTHRIDFRFRPDSVRLGSCLSALGIALPPTGWLGFTVAAALLVPAVQKVREAANRSAYAEAYKAARARAEAYASAADLKIARVLAIYDGGESSPPMPYVGNAMAEVRNMSAAPASPPPAPFNPGVNTTEVRVRVDFALAEK